MKIFSRHSLAIGVAVSALAGCASAPSSPTMADMMRQDANQAQAQVDLKNQIAKEWEKGNKLVQSGEKKLKSGDEKVKSGQKQLDEGKSLIDEGNKELDEGKKAMLESEMKFKTSFPAAPKAN